MTNEVWIAPPLFELEDGDAAPGRTRRGDHATSVAGAASVVYRAGSQKARLLAAYVDAAPAGLTDEEAAMITGLYEQRSACWWKRCNELREDGRIVPTGEQRDGVAGTPRMVCRAAHREEGTR